MKGDWKVSEEGTWGHSERQARYSKLMQETLGSLVLVQAGSGVDSTHLFLFVLSPELASIHGIYVYDLSQVILLGRCSPCGAAGTLGLKWPISCYLASDCTGTPNSPGSRKMQSVAKLPLIHLSPNRGVRKPDLPPGVLGFIQWGAS